MTSRIIECDTTNAERHASASAAMQTLTGAGFRLYAYLCSMAELEGGKAIFQLCAEDVCQYTGLCVRSYNSAVKDLTDHGYITPKEGKRRYYLFSGKCGDVS